MKAVDGVSVAIPRKECFGLLGVNGESPQCSIILNLLFLWFFANGVDSQEVVARVVFSRYLLVCS